jgi:septal ring factor EnvC (AmiA/AmiB activator)
MPNENPSGKVSRSVISNSNQGENAVSTDEENVVSSKRKKKKRKIKKIDVEKKILTESLKEAEMKQSYYKNVFDERANKNEELTKRIAELEEQNKNLLDQ